MLVFGHKVQLISIDWKAIKVFRLKVVPNTGDHVYDDSTDTYYVVQKVIHYPKKGIYLIVEEDNNRKKII